MFHLMNTGHTHFNTSNVTIQRFTALKELAQEEFQYIYCYYSTLFRLPLLSPYSHFNTSNVTIQHEILDNIRDEGTNFNTSNVTIQHITYVRYVEQNTNFNTSNVTIQHCLECCRYNSIWISIHLMLLFNGNKYGR